MSWTPDANQQAWPPPRPPAPAPTGVAGPPPGYGPPAWGPPQAPQPPPPVAHPGPPGVRHRPGPGLIVGLSGLLVMLLSFLALPWVSEGEDVSLSDIRDQFDGVDPPSDIAFIVNYAKGLWGVVLGVAILALVTSSFVPRSKGARIVIGLLVFAPVAFWLGALINAIDDRGVVGPRIGGAFLTLLASAFHVGAYVDLYVGEGAADPAYGVFAGFAGLILVFIGCVMGSRVEDVPPVNPAYPWAR
jgi:hypothetical protein